MPELPLRHVLILEVNLTGHHPVYLEKIAGKYLELGQVVTVVVSEKFKTHPLIIGLACTYKNTFHIFPLNEEKCIQAMESRSGDVGREVGLWKLFRESFASIDATLKVDYVFLPYADYCLNAIGLLGSPFGEINWGGICMRPTFHFKACGVLAPTPLMRHLKRMLFTRLLGLQSLSCLFTIDELLAGYVRKHNPKLAAKLIYLPDPSDPQLSLDAGELRQHYKIPQTAKVILVYGAIDERKGIFNLLDALEVASELAEWHVLVVGQQSSNVREEFLTQRWGSLKQAKRIHTIDHFVADEVEHHMLTICDVVWVAYVGHFTMSGVIVRAGMYCKPVIACEDGLIGWYAQKKSVGVVADKSMRSINKALKILSNEENAKMFGENGYAQFHNHTWSLYAQILTMGIEARHD